MVVVIVFKTGSNRGTNHGDQSHAEEAVVQTSEAQGTTIMRPFVALESDSLNSLKVTIQYGVQELLTQQVKSMMSNVLVETIKRDRENVAQQIRHINAKERELAKQLN